MQFVFIHYFVCTNLEPYLSPVCFRHLPYILITSQNGEKQIACLFVMITSISARATWHSQVSTGENAAYQANFLTLECIRQRTHTSSYKFNCVRLQEFLSISRPPNKQSRIIHRVYLPGSPFAGTSITLLSNCPAIAAPAWLDWYAACRLSRSCFHIKSRHSLCADLKPIKARKPVIGKKNI